MCLTKCFQSIFCCCSKRRSGHQSVRVKGWVAWCVIDSPVNTCHRQNLWLTNSNKKRRFRTLYSTNLTQCHVLFQLQDLYDSRTNLLTANSVFFNHETNVEIRPGISFYVSGILLSNCEGYESLMIIHSLFSLSKFELNHILLDFLWI